MPRYASFGYSSLPTPWLPAILGAILSLSYSPKTVQFLPSSSIPPEKVTPEAKLFEELSLDSIDAIDLVVRLQALTGRRFAPQDFKAVRTVGDVLDCIEKLVEQNETIKS
jgi:acyl carrier protein